MADRPVPTYLKCTGCGKVYPRNKTTAYAWMMVAVDLPVELEVAIRLAEHMQFTRTCAHCGIVSYADAKITTWEPISK